MWVHRKKRLHGNAGMSRPSTGMQGYKIAMWETFSSSHFSRFQRLLKMMYNSVADIFVGQAQKAIRARSAAVRARLIVQREAAERSLQAL